MSIVTSYSGCFTSLCLSPQLFFCGNDPCMAAVGHSPWQGEGEWVSQSPTHRDTPLDSDPKPYIQSHHLGENIFHQVIFLSCLYRANGHIHVQHDLFFHLFFILCICGHPSKDPQHASIETSLSFVFFKFCQAAASVTT